MRAEDRELLLKLLEAVETAIARELAKCVAERRMARFWSGVEYVQVLLDLRAKLAPQAKPKRSSACVWAPPQLQ